MLCMGPLDLTKYNGVILFMEHDRDKARNLKLSLSSFQQIFCLNINFHKSKLFYFREAQEVATQYTNLFVCAQDQFPINYFRILIHYRHITNAEQKHVEQRLEKGLSSCKIKLHFIGGRMILINYVLTNMDALHFLTYKRGRVKTRLFQILILLARRQ